MLPLHHDQSDVAIVQRIICDIKTNTAIEKVKIRQFIKWAFHSFNIL